MKFDIWSQTGMIFHSKKRIASSVFCWFDFLQLVHPKDDHFSIELLILQEILVSIDSTESQRKNPMDFVRLFQLVYDTIAYVSIWNDMRLNVNEGNYWLYQIDILEVITNEIDILNRKKNKC